jgi:predicted RNA-binding Zn-ribbon protein involved in translation (DUF1610 family)
MKRTGWVRRTQDRPAPAAGPALPQSSPITQVRVVPFVPARCPGCGEVAEVRDYGTRTQSEWIDRYHQCRRCSTKFVSREVLTHPST